MGAIVDTSTGKIIGAEKGTLVWWHEVGHLEYLKTNRGVLNQYAQQQYFRITFLTTVCALFFDFFKWGAITGLLLFLFYELYEEWWCWEFAKNNFNKMKGGKTKNGFRKKENATTKLSSARRFNNSK